MPAQYKKALCGVLLAVMLLLATASGCLHEQEEEADLIVIILRDAAAVPLVLAVEERHFAAAGLRVKLLPAGNRRELLTLLKAGAADGAVADLAVAVELQEKGFWAAAVSGNGLENSGSGAPGAVVFIGETLETKEEELALFYRVWEQTAAALDGQPFTQGHVLEEKWAFPCLWEPGTEVSFSAPSLPLPREEVENFLEQRQSEKEGAGSPPLIYENLVWLMAPP